MIKDYFDSVERLLKEVLATEKEAMEQGSKLIAEAIQNGGVVHLFGCGHSHIFAEEVFYRAGGLAAINPIFHEPLMLHEGAAHSSQLERKNNYAQTFLADSEFRTEDILIVFSTSGRNPVPIDVALFAKEKGVKVITITSKAYSESQVSRHTSKLRLYDVGDVVVDNKAPVGDAALSLPEVKVPFAPVSTAIGVTILQALFATAIEKMVSNAFEPPIFLSGNIENADEHNNRLLEKYGQRIPLLIEGMD